MKIQTKGTPVLQHALYFFLINAWTMFFVTPNPVNFFRLNFFRLRKGIYLPASFWKARAGSQDPIQCLFIPIAFL
jgi:hypothetical protein